MKKRPELSHKEKIKFLELMSQISSKSAFERKLGMTSADVEYYKKELGVETFEEARVSANKLKKQAASFKNENEITSQINRIREAERIAQSRLDALEQQKQLERPGRPVNVSAIRQEERESQRRLEQANNTRVPVEAEWRLPFEPGAGSETEQIERFHRNIMNRGLSFLRRVYNINNRQIENEASRLGLKIDWSMVRR